jgi:hypothetical protein
MQNRPIEVIGSDNRKYLIETERSRRSGYRYPMLDLSIIPVKIEVEYEYFKNSNIDISQEIVERYIQSIKQQYEPDRRLIYEIMKILERLRYFSKFF